MAESIMSTANLSGGDSMSDAVSTSLQQFSRPLIDPFDQRRPTDVGSDLVEGYGDVGAFLDLGVDEGLHHSRIISANGLWHALSHAASTVCHHVVEMIFQHRK